MFFFANKSRTNDKHDNIGLALSSLQDWLHLGDVSHGVDPVSSANVSHLLKLVLDLWVISDSLVHVVLVSWIWVDSTTLKWILTIATHFLDNSVRNLHDLWLLQVHELLSISGSEKCGNSDRLLHI